MPHRDAEAVTGGNNIATLNDKGYKRVYPYNENFDEFRNLALKHELIHTTQYSSSRPLGNVVLNAFDMSKKLKNYLEAYNIKLDNAVGSHLLLSVDFALYNKDDYGTPSERESYRLTESR